MNFHISQFLSPGRKEFVKGTLLLTGAGLFCRVLGFFYRIYMSRTIGAEGLGLYNMIHRCSVLPLRFAPVPSRRLCPSTLPPAGKKDRLFLNAVCSCL